MQTNLKRLKALRRFALAITVLNLLGHTILGFEQSHLQSVAALLAAYFTETAIEVARIWGTGQKPRFLVGSLQDRVDFFLPPHISGLAVAMLTFASDRVWVVVFAAVVAIGSKVLLRAPVDGRMRHFMNPSNLGIAVVLALFPSVSFAMPYQFTEIFTGIWGFLLPIVIIFTGSLLNAKLTGRLPLILGWLGAFVLQALLRAAFSDIRPFAALNMMTGAAFILFTFYMVTDPQTTPESKGAQVLFGASVSGFYGLLIVCGMNYTLPFALVVVCAIRGCYLWWRHWRETALPRGEAMIVPLSA